MNRVVVTGMGTVNPCGNSVEEFFKNLKNGKSGISELEKVSYEGCEVKVAAEIKEFQFEHAISKKEAKRMDLYTVYAMVAADEAIKDSGLNLEEVDKDMLSVFVGSGIGGFTTIENQMERGFEKGYQRIAPLFIPMAISNMAAGNIAIKYGANGSCLSLVTACATGNSCIGEGFRQIKHGYTDIAIVGGTEAAITKAGVAGFANLTALSTAGDVNRASIPFDKERGGFVIGEGAGILILESYESAKKRNAKIYAEVVGYGSTCDANHITTPIETGDIAAKAIVKSLKEGNVNPEDVTYINAHGTGTKYNDLSETCAIKLAFGDVAKDINISSTKSMTGHLLGGAAAIEAIATVKALENNVAYPTINLNVPDEECDLNYTPNTAVEREMKYAISTSLGFGGHNEVICFKKWEI